MPTVWPVYLHVGARSSNNGTVSVTTTSATSTLANAVWSAGV